MTGAFALGRAREQNRGVVECPHAASCGGCALIALSVEQQHARKSERVRSALAPYPPLTGVALSPLVGAEPNLRYRTRAKLAVSSRGKIGLFERASHDVVDIPECQVLTPVLHEVVAALRRLLAGASAISGVDVREVRDGGEPGALVTLIGARRDRAAIDALAQRMAAVPGVRGVAISARERDSAQLLGALPEVVIGPGLARDRLADDAPYVYAAHGGFTQAHRGQASRLVQQVAAQLQRALGSLEGTRILELYAGAGTLGLQLAARGAKPLLVERFEPALAHAVRAAREQGFLDVEARAHDAELAVESLLQANERFDAVIVNPPRRGVPARLRSSLAQLRPRALVYVSCDPDTLARDLADLARQGLVARSLVPYDMLPLAADVESVVLLEPGECEVAPVLYEDDALLIVDKPPHLPTVPHPEHPQSVLEQLQRAHGLPELRAVHRLDRGTSGVCIFAKTREATRVAAEALAAGQKHYLALARGRMHEKGNIKKPIAEDGRLREALTRYTRKVVLGGHTLVRVRPQEGRTHQVRKHLAAIGHPVLGDARYGDAASNRFFEHRHGLDRTFLHLARVELPTLGKVFEAALAADLDVVSRSLQG